MTKESVPVQNQPTQPDSPLAIASFVMGVTSLTGPGLFLGIPAIITAIIALKKKVGGHGLSIAGLVTGIISTVLSLLLVPLIILYFIALDKVSDHDTSVPHNYRDDWHESSRL